MLIPSSRGAVGAWFLVGALLMSTSIFVLNVSGLHRQRVEFSMKDWHGVIAKEAARSAFILLEAALKRRLWEAPPDANCLKSENFGLEGTTNEGVKYSVSATHDAKNNVFNMVSIAEYQGRKVWYRKSIKSLDASNFLVYSKVKEPSVLERGYFLPKTGVGLIGRQRRIYFEGPVEFQGALIRSDEATSWTDNSTPTLPGIFGVIIQGERVQFLGGIQYASYGTIPYPNPSGFGKAQQEYTLLGPYANRYSSQPSDLAAFITHDYNLATELYGRVITNDASGLQFSKYAKNIYPIALTCGSLPIMAQSSLDSGCYINDPYQWKSWNYLWAGVARWGASGNFTCFADNSTPEDQRKYCSNSNDFPKGFEKWISDANLKNVVLGKESEPLDFGKLTWDNMEALEEDALACGAVVTAASATSQYRDCNLAVSEKLKNYLISGEDPCYDVHKIDLEDLSSQLNNFNHSAYADVTSRERALRRVIYSKVKLELEQTDPDGLWTNLPNHARASLPLWFVNEDQFVIKPHQSDLTSPLDSDPGRRRAMYFNRGPGKKLSTLKIAMMSPEIIEVVSPFHVPYTFNQIKAAYPVVGGKIKPKIDIYTDYLHQENDGFKYGARDIHLSGLTLIGNQVSTQFKLRGLWGVPPSAAHKYVRRTCMMAEPGGTARLFSATGDKHIPAFVNNPSSLMPPYNASVKSRFYNGTTMELPHDPYVFRLQYINGAGRTSMVFHEGLKLVIDIDDTVQSRDLSQPIYSYSDWVQDLLVDLSDRKFSWNYPYLANKTNVSCIRGNILYKGTSTVNENALHLSVGADIHTTSQIAPPPDYERLGSLFSVELPIIEVSD